MEQNALPNGVYAAALTPMHQDLRCNHSLLLQHCRNLIERGCQGTVLFGTMGEGPSFSVAERIEALGQCVKAGMDPRRIILGNGSSNLADTAALSRAAVEIGCAAVLIAPPCFFKGVSEQGVIAFYRAVIERTADPSLRVILYHIPQYSGVPISLGIARALRREFPQTVIGLKESEGNLPFTLQMLKELPGFQVFVGKEAHIVEAVRAGGAGAICGLANLYPELISSLYAGDANPGSLVEIYDALKGLSFIPAIKAAMLRGSDGWAAVRPPLVPLEESQKETLVLRLSGAGFSWSKN